MWILMHRNDDGYPERPVSSGEEVVDFRGDVSVVCYHIGDAPHKPSSAGRIYVREPGDGDQWSREYYPTCFDCEWVWTDESSPPDYSPDRPQRRRTDPYINGKTLKEMENAKAN
ncbi:MAG: hypothetical protein ACWGQW_22945 [bacterium]